MELAVQGSLIRMTAVRVWVNGAYVDAPVGTTLTTSLTDTAGNAVPNATNLAMPLDPVGTANFSITLPSNVVLTAGAIYWVEVFVTYNGVSVPFRQKFRANYPVGGSTPS